MKISKSCINILVLVLLLAQMLIPTASASAAVNQTPPPPATTENLLAALVDSGSAAYFTGAEYIHTAPHVDSVDLTPETAAVFTAPVYIDPAKSKYNFPSSGDSFIGLTNGLATDMVAKGGSVDTWWDDTDVYECGTDGYPYREVCDTTILKISLNVPAGKSCLQFDSQFFSAEYPEYVGSEFNDAFLAELDVNDWEVDPDSGVITAPHNFALAPGKKSLSVNSGLPWSRDNAIGTPFWDIDNSTEIPVKHGATKRFTITTPITSGVHQLYLSIFDMGDTSLDSAVFLDNLQLTSVTCKAGIQTGTTPAPSSSGSTSSKKKIVKLPATGFAPKVKTSLPAQPAAKAYTKMSDLWLEIPSQNVSADIVGVPEDGNSWDVSWLGRSAGWLNGTAYPTWMGNSVITAHVTDADGKSGPFANLKDLQNGSKVIVHLNGEKYTYEVRTSSMVFPDTIDYAFEHLPGRSYLTLITCQGYNFLSDNYMFRRVVRAVLMNVSAE